jgi:hypothetical protein
MGHFRRYLLVSVFFLASGAISLAQPHSKIEPFVEDECQLKGPGDAAENPQLETAERPADQSLSDTLDPCNGVLEPPPVGDQELTIPPPAGGETPVIPPSALPEQQP